MNELTNYLVIVAAIAIILYCSCTLTLFCLRILIHKKLEELPEEELGEFKLKPIWNRSFQDGRLEEAFYKRGAWPRIRSKKIRDALVLQNRIRWISKLCVFILLTCCIPLLFIGYR